MDRGVKGCDWRGKLSRGSVTTVAFCSAIVAFCFIRPGEAGAAGPAESRTEIFPATFCCILPHLGWGKTAAAGLFRDWAGQTSGKGLDDGVFTLQWYWGGGRRRKGESVSNRRCWNVCGAGIGRWRRSEYWQVNQRMGPLMRGGNERRAGGAGSSAIAQGWLVNRGKPSWGLGCAN